MVFCYQVTASSDPSPSVVDTEEGIVGALMIVMQKRSKVIHSSGKLFTQLSSVLENCMCHIRATDTCMHK